MEMITRLRPSTPTAELAELINTAGLRTECGRPFDVEAVQWIRHAYRNPAPAPYCEGEISVADAAERLGCAAGVVYDCDRHWQARRPPRVAATACASAGMTRLRRPAAPASTRPDT